MGDNSFGLSGNGNKELLKLIYKLDFFQNNNLKIKKIACGGSFDDEFNIFLTGNLFKLFKFNLKKKNLECGKLFSVGSNYFGCIGNGHTFHVFTLYTNTIYNTNTIDTGKKYCHLLYQIEYFKNIFIEDVVCGFDHCLAISNNGEIFGWGNNRWGQLGNGKNGTWEQQETPIKIFKIN
jgi:hypothetical protein